MLYVVYEGGSLLDGTSKLHLQTRSHKTKVGELFDDMWYINYSVLGILLQVNQPCAMSVTMGNKPNVNLNITIC